MKEEKQRLSHPFTFHHKHIVHDRPLFRALLVTFLLVLISGLMCGFFRKHQFLPMLKEAGHELHLDDGIQIRSTFAKLFPLWV
mmetsp:Transcript_10168/g.15282  ORF Transcript_10168/g.15282 Transcript_10168/m.15282 type:complete len:83 (-) Transcript_10168:111-359(-)